MQFTREARCIRLPAPVHGTCQDRTRKNGFAMRWTLTGRDERRCGLGILLLLPCIVFLLTVCPSAASGEEPYLPGAAGAGDPYFPLDGNGGYDVRSYGLELKYDPTTDLLEGRAKIRVKATQNLSSVNLDL